MHHLAESSLARWARSGAMALTGPPDGPPLGPPAPLPGRLAVVARQLASTTAGTVHVDPLRLLTERAAIAGLRRGGTVSCGGGTRLVPVLDGWIAVSLARPSDVELLPAWLGLEPVPVPAPDEPVDAAIWEQVTVAAGLRRIGELEASGGLLGLAVGALPTAPVPVTAAAAPFADLPLQVERLGDAPRRSLDGAHVVDLSALWAGPLCGRLLAEAGARVVKVESVRRPDGARRGPAAFFDLMNAGKESVALDFTTPAGRRSLVALLEHADVVIEASRPRALEQLGIDARQVTTTGPRVWVSITGHGRQGAGANRVGFGDDAAVAGGLVAWEGDWPNFCVDAVADPAAGLVAAVAAASGLDAGGRWLLDVSLVGVASSLAGPTLDASGEVAAEPMAPPWRGRGPLLGADTAHVLARFGIAG